MSLLRINGKAMRAAGTLIVLLLYLDITSGDLESVLQRCCHSGETWAANHTTCTGPPHGSGDVPAPDRLSCLTSLYICCIRAHRRLDCERGKEAARGGRHCVSLPQHLGQTYRDCCDGCSLGIQAGTMRMLCSFTHFSFGSPWDEAYIDCCESSSAVQGTSPLSGKSRCDTDNPCSQKCEETGNQVLCSCYAGYALDEDQTTCEDVDECILGTHTCNPEVEVCLNAIGGFQCIEKSLPVPGQCPPGYVTNPETKTCDDMDECSLGLCPRDKICFNTVGSFTCISRNSSLINSVCTPGFRLELATGICIDVDECAEGIDRCEKSREICQNSYGAYNCIPKPTKNKDCPAGFKWSENKETCEDVNECEENLDDCLENMEECRNTVGGYECDPKCPVMMRFDPLQNKCVEMDACAEGLHTCKSDETCITINNAFVCVPKSVNHECEPGFKPVASPDETSQSCIDVNECEEYPDACDPETETCINGLGSYDCLPKQEQQVACPGGFRFEQSNNNCIDIDECAEGLDNCNRTTHDCINRDGSYECVFKSYSQKCPPGYKLNVQLRACEDVNECLDGKHKCLPGKEQCVNVPGAYRCQQITLPRTCPVGYNFSASTNSCEDIDECAVGAHSCNPNTQNCLNAIGSYRCVPKATCPHGYRWSRQRNKCDDVNECVEGTDDCDERTQYCVNTPGSYQCQSRPQQQVQRCGIGFTYDTNREECIDINECDIIRPCQPDQICENSVGSYRCTCQLGYMLDTITKQCRDVNECQLGLHSCAESQRCDNTIGSFTCVRTTSCGTGYTLNAATGHCEDDDECILNTHNCGPGFVCRNIQGSFRCDRVKCPSGQKLLSDGSCKVVVCAKGMETDDSGNCVDINECARSSICRANQRCINTIGSYRCQNLLNCGPGFELNEFGNQCIDVDECARRIDECGSQQICRNRIGGYLCECPRGYTLNAQRECEDIDECTRFRGQVCSSISECINTQGSYTCNCKEGFRKADDDKNCIDIDECAELPNICQQTCNNVWGSYQCSCKQGYTLGEDSRSCKDIDECKMWEGRGNLCIGFCVNEPGSFSCSCPEGYRLSPDKRTCQDIDECSEQNVCHSDQEVCLNTRGGYKCNRIVCPPNYVRDKDHRNRCKKASKECHRDDTDCLKEPLSFSYNYLTFVSNIRIPLTGQLDLFTMRGPRFTFTTVQFNLELKSARAPEGISPATKEYFHLRRTAYNEAMVSLVKTIPGPQEIELDLVMKMYHNGLFGGVAVAKIFIFVTQHEF